MSSSATNTLTKRRSSPRSSKSRSAKPGCAGPSWASTSAPWPGPALISAAPPDSSRSCVGMRTVTDIEGLLLLERLGRERVVERVERRRDHRGGPAALDHGVERLQPVAGHGGDDALVGTYHAFCTE